MPINWDDPEQRFHLIERVGPDEYNRLHQDHIKRSTVATINGYPIHPVGSRYGQLFMVSGCNAAFRTQAEAEAFAKTQPPLCDVCKGRGWIEAKVWADARAFSTEPAATRVTCSVCDGTGKLEPMGEPK